MDFIGELYNIKAIDVIPSVMKYGILSNAEAIRMGVDSISIAMKVIQEKRDHIVIPNGLKLHQYANLYFHARNPMLSKLCYLKKTDQLCVLTIRDDVLNIEGVVISDQNASSSYVRFLSSDQMNELDFDKIYAQSWTHPGNPPAFFEHKSKKCAEVLVPEGIPPSYIVSAHVANIKAKEYLRSKGFDLEIDITPDMFFC